MSDARFHDPETASSSGASQVPIQPMNIPVPEECQAAILCGLPLDARNTMCASGNVLESLPVREGQPSVLFGNSRNLASSSAGLRHNTAGNTMVPEREVRQEPQDSSISVPRFQEWAGRLNHTGRTYSHNGVTDYPRYPISEMHLGTFPDSMEFQSWKLNFKTEKCSKLADPQLTMHWIKEVEIAKSIDELMTSRSIVERTDFRDYDMLDAMIESALKRLVHF